MLTKGRPPISLTYLLGLLCYRGDWPLEEMELIHQYLADTTEFELGIKHYGA